MNRPFAWKPVEHVRAILAHRRSGSQIAWRIPLVLVLSLLIFPPNGHVPVADAATSGRVAYVTDFGPGLTDAVFPTGLASSGSSIFVNAVGGGPVADGVIYNGVTFKNVPVSSLDGGGVAALAGFDTVLLYEFCDIAGHPAAEAAVNTFLNNGGKVLIFAADRCATSEAGQADFSGFRFPFSTDAPGPLGAGGSYTFIEPSTLTTVLGGGPQTGDSVGDANIFTSNAGGWCVALKGQNATGNNNFVEAYARTASGGLAIYEGEDFWFTFGPTAHLKQVFDNMLAQAYNPDALPCSIPASGIKLEPVTGSDNVGTPHTDTATVISADGSPQSGVTVNFKIISGPDAGTPGTAVTDASGHATFTFTDTTTPGDDVVVASFVDSNGITESSNQAVEHWIAIPTTLTYTGDTTQDYNDQATLSARLINKTTNTGVPGQSISFAIGAESCSAVADATGNASCAVTLGDAPNTYTVKATYAGSSPYLPSSASAPFTVTLEESALVSTPNLQLFAANSTATLSSVLTDPNGGGPIGGKPVSMTLGSGSSAQSCTGTTDASGTATCSINPVTVPLGPQPVADSFAGDAYYKPASYAQQALVYANLASGSFVIGDATVAAASPTTSVNWWGSKWWKNNSLSGGTAPAAFKGFADTLSTKPAACGGSWTTDPGNSSGPPSSVPSYMSVIVSSTIAKSGSTISGDVPEIVVVKTDGGYAANPGHPGTGTIVATLCHS